MDSQEFEDILAAVRRFVRNDVIPLEDEIEETDEIPEQIRKQAAEMGLFGYALPVEFGGLGLTMMEELRLAFEVGYTSPAFRSMFGINNGLAGQVFVNIGTDEQKSEVLPRLASGEWVASFGLTESEAGSDPTNLRTTAERVDGGYRITGQKRYITNATRADVFVVFARTGGPGADGISAFMVPASTPGITVGPKDKKMGQRGTSTAEVFLDGAEVPQSALIGGEEGVGFRAAMSSIAKGRVHIAGICVGLATRILDETIAHVAVARQGSRPIGDFQLVQALVADSQVDVQAGRALALQAAAAYDDRSDRRLLPNCAKLFCSEAVDRVADRAVQAFGGMGYMHSVPVERFYRDARLFRIYEGTSEVQRSSIGRESIRRARA